AVRLAERRVLIDTEASLNEQHLPESELFLREEAELLGLGEALDGRRRRGGRHQIGAARRQSDADAREIVVDPVDVLTAERGVRGDRTVGEVRVDVAKVVDRVDV